MGTLQEQTRLQNDFQSHLLLHQVCHVATVEDFFELGSEAGRQKAEALLTVPTQPINAV